MDLQFGIPSIRIVISSISSIISIITIISNIIMNFYISNEFSITKGFSIMSTIRINENKYYQMQLSIIIKY